MSKYIELAKKLHALVIQGVGGEKENAKQMLDRLMKQHGISMEEIEDDHREWRPFTIKTGTKWLFRQVAVSCSDKVMGAWSVPRFPSQVEVMCTAAERIEIEAKYAFYLKAYEKDLAIFQSAFIQSNELYPSPTHEMYKDKEEKPPRKKTLEEEQRDWEVIQMASKMKSHDYHKQLTKS